MFLGSVKKLLRGDVNTVTFVTERGSVNRPVYDQRKPELILLYIVTKREQQQKDGKYVINFINVIFSIPERNQFS
jgi:hypothetical protein